MAILDEIDSAVSAHGQWKHKLRKAIDTGECESTPARVKQDNNCSFGKWLHHRIGEEYKATPHYHEIVTLHAAFHREAGSILEIALNGDKQAAFERLKIGSDFAIISASLTSKMREWQQWLEKQHLA